MLWAELITATAVTPQITDTVIRVMSYAPWSEEQIGRGAKVREAISEAMLAVIANVPPSPTRTTCLRNLIEARLNANAAITFCGEL